MKRVVSETVRLCRESGLKVEPVLIGYLACLQEVQKAWGPVSLTEELSEDKALTAAKFIKDQIVKKDDPVLSTAKLQVLMEAAYKAQKESVEMEQMEHQEKVDMFARAITSGRPLKENTLDAYEKFYQRMMEYVCCKTGLERGMTDELAKQEVRAAMESVFPLSTLARYLTLTEEEKGQQVEELARVTLGICIFNSSLSRGGYALPPPPSSVLPQAQRLLKDLIKTANELRKDMAVYHSLVKNAESNKMQVVRLQQELACVCQALVYAEAQRRDLEEGLGLVGELEAELEHMNMQAQDTVGGSAAVPKEAIFPLLDRVGQLQMMLSDELRLLVVRHRLYEELQKLIGIGYTSHLSKMGKTLRQTSATSASHPSGEPPLDEFLENLPEGLDYEAPSSSSASPSAANSAPDPSVSLSGFCPVMLAQRSGLLVRAAPHLGAIRYQDQVYGFSSSTAMQSFVTGPESLMSQLHDELREQPVMYHLLKMSPPSCSTATTQVVLTVLSQPMKCDFGTQTPVHFVERHIDVNYEWNQWALRRRALSLANLRQHRTHSTQTLLTHFKRDNETQVWKPKDAAIQTKVNKGQTMPKKLQYVRGLRGAHDVKMNVVRLDLDLGQPHQH